MNKNCQTLKSLAGHSFTNPYSKILQYNPKQ